MKIMKLVLVLVVVMSLTACGTLAIPTPDFPQPLDRGEPFGGVSFGADETDTLKGFLEPGDYMSLLSAVTSAAGSGATYYVTGSEGWKQTTSNMLVAGAGSCEGYHGSNSPLSSLLDENTDFHLTAEELTIFTSDLIDSEVGAGELGSRMAELVKNSREPAAVMLWTVSCRFEGTVRFQKYSEGKPAYVDVEGYEGERDVLLAAIGPDSVVTAFDERLQKGLKQYGLTAETQYYSNRTEAEHQVSGFTATPTFTENTENSASQVNYSFNLTELNPERLETPLMDGVLSFQYEEFSTEKVFTLGLYTREELPDVRAEISLLRTYDEEEEEWVEISPAELSLTSPVRLNSLPGSCEDAPEELGMICSGPVTYFQLSGEKPHAPLAVTIRIYPVDNGNNEVHSSSLAAYMKAAKEEDASAEAFAYLMDYNIMVSALEHELLDRSQQSVATINILIAN